MNKFKIKELHNARVDREEKLKSPLPFDAEFITPTKLYICIKLYLISITSKAV